MDTKYHYTPLTEQEFKERFPQKLSWKDYSSLPIFVLFFSIFILFLFMLVFFWGAKDKKGNSLIVDDKAIAKQSAELTKIEINNKVDFSKKESFLFFYDNEKLYFSLPPFPENFSIEICAVKETTEKGSKNFRKIALIEKQPEPAGWYYIPVQLAPLEELYILKKPVKIMQKDFLQKMQPKKLGN